MKTRVLSAIVAFMIFIPIFVIGGKVFNISIFLVALLGLKELMQVRENKKKYPDFMRFIAYIMLAFIYFGNALAKDLSFTIDYRLLTGLFLVIFVPVLLYHNEKYYDATDAFTLLASILFLGFSMSLFSVYRNIDLKLIIFLFLITIITDTYAYFCGRLIGKNKLLETVSPKKTWEGSIGGSLVGTFVATVYYITVINPSVNLIKIVLICLFLSVIGQFGDLFFSAIKREHKVKDFSYIMPGHGGILDRLDSIIFVMLAFTFFIGII